MTPQRATSARSSETADPRPDPVGEPQASATGEVGSEGGGPAEVVQADRVSERESAASGPDNPRASWAIPALLIAIIVVAAIVVWYVAGAIGR